jgi:hypothetical protein
VGEEEFELVVWAEVSLGADPDRSDAEFVILAQFGWSGADSSWR